MQHRVEIRRPVWLLAILSLFIAILACDPPPVTGVNCLEEQADGSILAIEEYGAYLSRDGGLSWEPGERVAFTDYCRYPYSSDEAWTLTAPANPTLMYRFTPNGSIERSTDGGTTWRREIDLSGTEARTLYYIRFRNDGFEYRSGPSDALIHSGTGNLVVAMSYEGVLVRTPQGKWSWIGVDKYRRVDMRNPFISIPLIWGELIMGLAFAITVISTVMLLSQKEENIWNIILGIGATFVSSFLLGALTYAISLAVAPLFTPEVPDWTSAIWLVVLMTMLCLPFIVGFVVSKKTHQEQTSLFIWAVASWSYLILGWLPANLEPRDPTGITGSIVFSVPLVILGIVVSTYVLLRLYKTSPRALVPTLIPGVVTFLIVAGVYALWAIGGIAYYRWATFWAWGLSLLNLFIYTKILKYFSLPTESPSHSGEITSFSEPSSSYPDA